MYLGNDLILTDDERKFDAILMAAKDKETHAGFKLPGNYSGAIHFFHALDQIKDSKVFKLIRKMPKGAVLHAHDTALLSTDKLMEFIKYDNLWMCEKENEIKFWFSKTKSNIKQPCTGSDWIEVKNVRNNEDFKVKVRKALTLYTKTPEIEYRNIKEVWNKFLSKFGAIEGLVGYKKVWKEYFKQTLQEFLDDGVQYLEFRGLLPPVYELDGTFNTKIQIVKAYTEVLQDFLLNHPSFIGAKFIYAPLRFVTASGIADYRETYTQLKTKFPNFIAGFDLVGPEETNFPLKNFIQELEKFPNDTNFFFHAGETNWNGLDVDENLVDAILLGTKRIGHGFASVKHPKVLEEIKRRDIAIEICPVSNQVLKLVADHRNHPASILFSDQNFPVVVSSDDPSLWQATPLSHDFFLAFMGIASANANVRFLKKLAMNSLKYSAMNELETSAAMKKWEREWNKYIKNVLEEEKLSQVNFNKHK
uniref:Adenosine deaminase n=1 Tax=Culicoides sonorensis TaxID=179676 RepID=A0A336LR32_CULSO